MRIKSGLFLSLIVALASVPANAEKPSETRVLQFSGYRWVVKQSNSPVGPGPNYFSGREEDVWVDREGKLHLKISRHDGHWWAAEVFTEKNLGYGTYLFVVAGRPDLLDRNAVLGLFTWDDTTAHTDANSEIDVEFARWGDPAQKILQYSVHPTRGPEGRDYVIYRDRFFEKEVSIESGVSVHRIIWAPDSVRIASFDGSFSRPMAEWVCGGAGSASGQGAEARSSRPGIPEPGPKTRARINLWLVDLTPAAHGTPPSDGKEIEVVIEKFEFIPANL